MSDHSIFGFLEKQNCFQTFPPSLTYHGDELGKLQLKFDGDNLRDIGDWPHQFVVIGKEVIVQSLGVRISTKNKHFHRFHIITSTTV